MRYNANFMIGEIEISSTGSSYFIADIGANHDGDLQRAKDLIRLAKDAGADAAKFQHFQAARIVSDFGFRSLGGQFSHQAKWDKPIYDVYEQYSLNRDWNVALAETAQEVCIHWLTTPYDIDAADSVEQLLPAFKIGSGDITWLDFIEYIASKGKPVILSTGASDMKDVEEAVEVSLDKNPNLCLLQCNTNYTGDSSNFKHVNLRTLQAFALHWPGMPLGLSDHTPGHAAVLGAVALGARVIEKHFTDDTSRVGPDHPFAMTPQTWRDMVDRTRELESALGDGVKRVEANEADTVVLQRRCLRMTRPMSAGETLGETDLEALRPAPADAVEPKSLSAVRGKRLAVDKVSGDALFWADLEP